MNARQHPDDHALSAAALWQCAVQAAVLLAIDPVRLGGVRVRAAPGPVRDAWLDLLRGMMGSAPFRRMPVTISDERLLGGLDLSATLAAGRPVLQRGLLADADGGVLVLTMAERLPAGTCARLAAVMDAGDVVIARDGLDQRHSTRFAVVALDEGVQDDEAVSPALRERLAFDIDLRAIPWQLVTGEHASTVSPQEIALARHNLVHTEVPDALLDALCGAALGLGIASARASLLALAAARASAALDGNVTATDDDVRVAASLVLAPRATRLPAQPDAMEEDSAPDETPPPSQAQAQDSGTQADADQQTDPPMPPQDLQQALDDRVLEAAKAAIPAGLLLQMLGGAPKRSHAGAFGAAIKAGLRGRPAGSRRARPTPGSRLHLIDTLRAAAPWQRLRTASASVPDAASENRSSRSRIQVRAEDFHVARIRQKTATATLFVVDASGSSALHRLAEAKGAVELLLADCYVRRDQVAVMAFRGQRAELLLPPTRSLVRAKRSLAGLPGGGGTPLATAVDAATMMAQGLQRRGLSPLIVMLTDGRANVARHGGGGRELAHADALQASRQLALTGAAVLFIDTSPRPQPQAAELAAAMRARYLPLPHAGAAVVSQAVREASREVSREGVHRLARDGAR